MPGNEVGDRIHNFFGQENSSQGQHHSQLVDGSWSSLNNNPWAGNQRQGAPLISNLKNYNGQQSADSDRGLGGQPSSLQHELNFTKSALKPELTRSQSPNQSPNLNGYIHGHQLLQTRQNESNFLGVDAEYNQHNLTSRGLSLRDSQLGNGPGPEQSKKNPLNLESTESPVNYDFFGGQQQMSNQHPGMLQSLTRHQSAINDTGINDIQLLQQQVMLKKLQDLQRQQQLHGPQFQQYESRQSNPINQVSSIGKQTPGSQTSALINGIPMQDPSNFSWQPELVAGSANWLQRSTPSVMHVSSNGFMFSPDQAQMRMMGFDQSLYGVPITSSRTNSSQISPIQMQKPTLPPISGGTNSFPGNQYAAFPNQVGLQEGAMASRQGYQGKSISGPAGSQSINSGLNLENLPRMNSQQNGAPMHEYHEMQEFVSPLEASQEKTTLQDGSSQNAAALDPEEEKILFGSDDNLWESFTRSTNLGSNLLDNTDFLGANPSMQSGSWSALMQSAVAESVSGDTRTQEGWGGLSMQNSEPSATSQQSSYVNDGSKQPSAWPDGNLHTVSAMNSRPLPVFVDSNININSVSGIQQPGVKTSQEQSEQLLNNSQILAQQLSVEGNKWLGSSISTIQKPVVEGSQFYRNVTQPSNMEPVDQSSNGLNGWNFIDSVSPGEVATMKNQDDETSLQIHYSGDQGNAVNEKTSYGIDVHKITSVSNVNEHASSSMRHTQINKNDSELSNATTVSGLSTTRVNQRHSQHPPNSSLNFWKNVKPVDPATNEVPVKHHHHLNKSPQNVESSGNRGPSNGAMENETESPYIREKSSDSHHSNLSQNTSTTGLKENVWLDASDSRTLPGGKQKLAGQVGRKPFATRKFQYHPMGDVEIGTESAYEIKTIAQSQTMLQQISRGLQGHDHLYVGQSKALSLSKNFTENDKVCLPGFQGNMIYRDEVSSKVMHPSSKPVTSAPYDQLVDTCSKNMTASSSQNMLELLHKVDQAKEHGSATPFSSSDRNQSEMPEAETSDGSVDHFKHKSSASQGFGLQLGPPSQRMPLPEHGLPFKSCSQGVKSPSSVHSAAQMGQKGHTWLASTVCDQPLFLSHETYQGDSRNKISNDLGSFSAGFLHPKSQNLQMSGPNGQVKENQSVHVTSNRFASPSKCVDNDRLQNSQSSEALVRDMSTGNLPNEIPSSSGTTQLGDDPNNSVRCSVQPFPVLEAMPVPHPSGPGLFQQGVISKMSPDVWAGIPNHHYNLSAAQTSSNFSNSYPHSSNHMEKVSSLPPKLDEQTAVRGGHGQHGFAAYSLNNVQGNVRKELPMKEVLSDSDATEKVGVAKLIATESVDNCLSDAALSNSNTAQKNTEAFDCSLKPTNIQNNYSLLNQMQAMKSTEADPEYRSVKRLKGPESGLLVQQVSVPGAQQLHSGSMAMTANTSMLSLPARDSTMLSFSTKPGDCDSQSLTNRSSTVAGVGEHSQISPQMAPSWFDQYGNFKKGMVPTYDVQGIAAIKNVEQPFAVEKSSDFQAGKSTNPNVFAGASQLLNAQQTPVLLSTEHPSSSSSQLLPLPIIGQSPILLRPNKRKADTSKCLPWHQVIAQGVQKLQSISVAETEWAQVANRLMEKVEDEMELIEDVPPILKSKRRLVLTTQLMQQLFCAPSSKVLSLHTTTHHETMAYFVARSALGDACGCISSSRSGHSVHPKSGYRWAGTIETSERIDDQYISKAMEKFIDQAKKLEDDFLRLDKRASIIDLRVECQDLEKFSVINRFAKFHGRGQVDGAESSSSSDVYANSPKSCLQRYVTALPMPRNLPDRVQCLSL